MSQSFHREVKDNFQIDRYGSGVPVSVCLGGLAYAPSDMVELGARLEGTTFVLNNPIHSGVIQRTQDWQSELRERYAKVCEEMHADFLVGHSCGSFDAIAIQDRIPSLQGVVMLTPPFAKAFSGNNIARYPDFGLLDSCLADICGDIDDERYLQMLQDHDQEYGSRIKDIYKKEMPKPRDVESILRTIGESRLPILTILGTRDRWNQTGTFRDSSSNGKIVKEIQHGHYPHISNPDLVASLMNDWMRGNFIDRMAKGEANANRVLEQIAV